MSDLDSITDVHETGSALPTFPLDDAPAAPTRPEREGLPRGFRMRADRHYVDHVTAEVGGHPVRLIPTDQIASTSTADQAALRPLIESVRAHGIVQPIIVRKLDESYRVIAGHKRIAAARVLRLPNVPCLVHHVDEAQAGALEEAAAVHVVPPSAPDTRAPMIGAVEHAIVQHLAAVEASTAIIPTGPPHLTRAALDLIGAHSWRAARLLDVVRAIEFPPARPKKGRPVASLIERVADGFAAEARVSGVTVATRIEGAAGSVPFEPDLVVTVSAAVLAMIPLIDNVTEGTPTIGVFASCPDSDSLQVVVDQSTVAVSADLASRFFDGAWTGRPGGAAAAGCALAVATLAERSGGSARFEVNARGDAAIVIDLPLPGCRTVA